MGTFERYTRMITISEADLRPLPVSQEDDRAEDVVVDIIQEAFQYGEPTGIIASGHTPVGYVTFEELNLDPDTIDLPVSHFMKKFNETDFLGPSTSLFEAIAAFNANTLPNKTFFIRRDQMPLAQLTKEGLYNGRGMRTCIHALLASLESTLLNIMILSPSEAISWLLPQHQDEAYKLYDRKQHPRKPKGGYHKHLLLGCTSFATKMHIVRRLEFARVHKMNNLFDREYIKFITGVRNFLCHPEHDLNSTFPGEPIFIGKVTTFASKIQQTSEIEQRLAAFLP